MSSEKLPPEPPARPSTKAAERLAVIVDAAERAALSVIDDAEKEAQRYLEEAKARADRIAASRLRDTADELERRGGAPLDPTPPPPPPSPEVAETAAVAETADDAEPRLRSVTPADRAEDSADSSAPKPAAKTQSAPKATTGARDSSGQPGSAAARLLATQMAVSGSSRQEIEMRLRSGFEIEDASEILDAILGPEG